MKVPIKRIMIPKPSNDGKTKEIPSAAVQVSTNCPEHPPLRKNGERHLLISGNTDNFYENFRSTKIWIYILRFLYRWRRTHPAPNRNNRLSLEIHTSSLLHRWRFLWQREARRIHPWTIQLLKHKTFNSILYPISLLNNEFNNSSYIHMYVFNISFFRYIRDRWVKDQNEYIEVIKF